MHPPPHLTKFRRKILVSQSNRATTLVLLLQLFGSGSQVAMSSALSQRMLSLSRAPGSRHRTPTLFRMPFTTCRSLPREQSNANTKSQHPTQRVSKSAVEPPEIPSFSFRGLGASRPVKIVVWTALGVLGTVETVFYTRAAWQWMYPKTEDVSSSESSE